MTNGTAFYYSYIFEPSGLTTKRAPVRRICVLAKGLLRWQDFQIGGFKEPRFDIDAVCRVRPGGISRCYMRLLR